MTRALSARAGDAVVAGDDDLQETGGIRPPTIRNLELNAGSDNRLAQMLRWSARDCLPQMLMHSRDEPGAAEWQFDEYLHNVALLQQNQTIYGVSPVVMEFRRRSMPEPEDPSSMQPYSRFLTPTGIAQRRSICRPLDNSQ